VIAANQAGAANYNAAVQATQSFGVIGGFALTVSNANSAVGTVVSDVGGISCGQTCGSAFATGLSVTFTALPVDGYQFSGWGGDCAVCGYGNFCKLTMNAGKSCTAKFEVFKRHKPLWKSILLPK
jgi:hypothetical protein